MIEKETAPAMWYEELDPLDPCVDPEDYPTDEEAAEIQGWIHAEYEEGTR